MYDKAPTVPLKGSLKEALFLTVWLRRQEADILKQRLLAQGMMDISENKAENTAKVFKMYAAAALPFAEKNQSATDARMKEVMEKEVKKGIIVFNPPEINPLVTRAKAMRLPDEYRQRLAARRKKNS